MTPRDPRHSGESGAVAVITALLLTVLLLFSALVIDLGALRADRALGQSVSDMAAAAAAQEYQAMEYGSARDACIEAISYAEENLGLSLSPGPGEGCEDVFPSATDEQACDPSNPWAPAVYKGGDYTVTVSIPVVDDDPLMGSQAIDDSIDRDACDRVSVRVNRTRDYWLAQAGGVGSSGGETSVGAVGRGTGPGEEAEFASLIILNERHCKALTTAGQANNQVRVEGTTVGGVYYPGIITVDSLDDGCSNPNQIIRTDGNNSTIYAEDHIFSHQLQQDPGSMAVVADGNVTPDPEPGHARTRQRVDHVYNCRSSYPASERWSPNHADSVSSSGPCGEAGVLPPYITALHAAYQSLTAAPAGWGEISGDACHNLTGHYGPGAGDDETHWFVDCPGTNNQGFRPNDVHFDGVEAVVTRGRINLGNDTFRVTGDDVGDGSAGSGAVLYLQAGAFEAGSADIHLLDTFVYIHNGAGNRPLNIGAGAVVEWEAPVDRTDDETPTECDAYDAAYDYNGGPNPAPPGICFAPLALWTNNFARHDLGGSGDVTTVGTFFTPNSEEFRLQGGAGNDYRQSQFFAGRLRAGGGGSVTMIPNPHTNVPTEPLAPRLIR
jgi:hypothetical protein